MRLKPLNPRRSPTEARKDARLRPDLHAAGRRRREAVGFRHAARRPADRVTRGADEDHDHLLRRLKLPPRGLQAGGRDRGGDRYRARAHRRRGRDLRRHRGRRADLFQARSGEVPRARGDSRSAPPLGTSPPGEICGLARRRAVRQPSLRAARAAAPVCCERDPRRPGRSDGAAPVRRPGRGRTRAPPSRPAR